MTNEMLIDIGLGIQYQTVLGELYLMQEEHHDDGERQCHQQPGGVHICA